MKDLTRDEFIIKLDEICRKYATHPMRVGERIKNIPESLPEICKGTVVDLFTSGNLGISESHFLKKYLEELQLKGYVTFYGEGLDD